MGRGIRARRSGSVVDRTSWKVRAGEMVRDWQRGVKTSGLFSRCFLISMGDEGVRLILPSGLNVLRPLMYWTAGVDMMLIA